MGVEDEELIARQVWTYELTHVLHEAVLVTEAVVIDGVGLMCLSVSQGNVDVEEVLAWSRIPTEDMAKQLGLQSLDLVSHKRMQQE